jgi:hypothetical protein
MPRFPKTTCRAGRIRISRSIRCRTAFATERASKHPDKHMIRCRCGHVFKFRQKTAYAEGGEPRR